MRRHAVAPHAYFRATVLMSIAEALLWPVGSAAHSASDAYLTLSADERNGSVVLHGQWDIALRDLDFLLRLDDNGDGEVSWGEVKQHLSVIEHYAYSQLLFRDETNTACVIHPTRDLIDAHADGAYAALFFDVSCPRAPQSLTLSYSLFFAIDPSHRGIFVMRSGSATSTALLSPQNARITLPLSAAK